jgi:hypothetical protein
MFAYKKIAALNMFDNGAAARPCLRTLLILTSFAGTGAVALLNGTEINADSVSTDIEMIIATLANSYLSHLFYRGIQGQQ